jgi:hypothetical protein
VAAAVAAVAELVVVELATVAVAMVDQVMAMVMIFVESRIKNALCARIKAIAINQRGIKANINAVHVEKSFKIDNSISNCWLYSSVKRGTNRFWV